MSASAALPSAWFRRPATQVAQDLIGAYLCSASGARLMISETESYPGSHDQATALHLKRRRHSQLMLGEGGIWYVYPVYGVHLMLNLVTGGAGSAESVLIRAAFDPVLQSSFDSLCDSSFDPKLCSGPAKLTRHLGVTKALSGSPIEPVSGFWIEAGTRVQTHELGVGARIGIDYAGEDAALPLRFGIKNHPSLSKRFT